MINESSYSGAYIPARPKTRSFIGPDLSIEKPSKPNTVFIDWGPELPSFYAVDRLSVLIRDPHWVCFHWFLEGTRSKRWRKRLNCEPRFYLILESKDSTRFEYEVKRDCPFLWVKTQPGKPYLARIIIRHEGKTLEICRTCEFSTPTPWVKAASTEIPNFVKEAIKRYGYHTKEEWENLSFPLSPELSQTAEEGSFRQVKTGDYSKNASYGFPVSSSDYFQG